MSRLRSDTGADLPPECIEALAAAVKPAELGAQLRERLRSRVLQGAAGRAQVVPSGGGTWIEVAPGIDMRSLERDELAGTHTALLRMHPGCIIPEHRHRQREEFVVLEGECCIGAQRLSAGDVHVTEAGAWHAAVSTAGGVLVLLRGEYPLPEPGSIPAGG